MATPIPRNDARFSLAEIARATAGRIVGDAAEVTSVCTDSRAATAGALYVALRGERLDGHAYVGAALAQGAAAALVADASTLPAGATGIVVADTLRALGDIAALHRARWGGRVIAITGSAGKTTTKELTCAALRAAGARVTCSVGNLNNFVGAPMSLLCLDETSDLAVIEISTSAPGEIARLSEICRPDIGVVTAVAAAHTAGLGSVEHVASEKAALLRALSPEGVAIYRVDQPELVTQLAGVRARNRIGFGRAQNAAVRLVRTELRATPSMLCELRLAEPARSLECELQLFGEGPALDAAAALAVVLATLGARALDAALRGLGEVRPPSGRLRPMPGASGSLVLDDTYNANPASMQLSVDTAIALARVRGGRAVLVLGDMLELGERSVRDHRALGERAAQAGVAAFVACGREMTSAAESAREHARDAGLELSIAHLSDPSGAAGIVRPLLRAGDVVLVKGSRGVGMERVLDGLAVAAGDTP